MWGHIMTEAITLQNFNFGFSTHKSDILVHLSQWQYWWWFWFSLLWTLYFYIILRVLQNRTMQFNPVLNTSIRGHGKWGDFLVALIPLSWCGNILVNSNFILRMIEWQNESSLFTLRIQGKQWYWSYKFEGLTSRELFAVPKNIGENKWLLNNPNEIYTFDTYYQAETAGTELEANWLYLKELDKEGIRLSELDTKALSGQNIPLDLDSYLLADQNLYITKDNIDNNNIWITNLEDKIRNHQTLLVSAYAQYNATFTKSQQSAYKEHILPIIDNNLSYMFDDAFNERNEIIKNTSLTSHITQVKHFDHALLEETHNTAGNVLEKYNSKNLRFIKGYLNRHVLDILRTTPNCEKPLLFNLEFCNEEAHFAQKSLNNELIWGFKQKKYKRLQMLKFKPRTTYDPITFEATKGKPTSALVLRSTIGEPLNFKNNKNTEYDLHENFNYQNAVVYNRHRSELVPVNLARRLLRTKRTLVLPAHTNITLITNSYDVVHSWFIPGLGIKVDCVPGRSTHHTFYVDNVGFYYGQCAEICGRYHHHMPIRLCALPFEQFLVWWQHKGLRRSHRVSLINNSQSIDGSAVKFRYKW